MAYWTQTADGALTLPTAGNVADFGSSTALSDAGDVLVASAYDFTLGVTVVLTYDRVSGAWVQRGTALPTTGTSGYVALSLSGTGDVLAVGLLDSTVKGQVFVYDRSGSTWVQRGAALTNTSVLNSFGAGVALSQDGSVLVASAQRVSSVWSCYTYDVSGTSWVLRPGYVAGQSVALSNTAGILAAGVPTGSGYVAVYDDSAGAWVQRGVSITVSGSSGFGAWVALSGGGELLVVGETTSSSTGRVHSFSASGVDWTLAGAALDIPTVTTFDNFVAVALSSDGTVLTVGAYGWDGAAFNYGGVFTYSSAGVSPTLFWTNLFGQREAA